jgi:hypothetical protein
MLRGESGRAARLSNKRMSLRIPNTDSCKTREHMIEICRDICRENDETASKGMSVLQVEIKLEKYHNTSVPSWAWVSFDSQESFHFSFWIVASSSKQFSRLWGRRDLVPALNSLARWRKCFFLFGICLRSSSRYCLSDSLSSFCKGFSFLQV